MKQGSSLLAFHTQVSVFFSQAFFLWSFVIVIFFNFFWFFLFFLKLRVFFLITMLLYSCSHFAMYAYTSYLLLLWWLPFPFVAGGDGSNAFCFNHSNSFQFYGIRFQGLLAAVPVRPPKYCTPFFNKSTSLHTSHSYIAYKGSNISHKLTNKINVCCLFGILSNVFVQDMRS